jgi:HEAT repeat protein
MDTDRLAPLLAALQDDRRDIQLQASQALLNLRDPALIPALLAALAMPQRHIQGLVATVLGTLADQRAVLPLIDLLRSAKPGSVAEMVMDYFANVRAQAAEALGLLGDRQAVDPLIDALADEDAWTRSKAAQALGRLGDRRAVEPLITLLRAGQHPSTATILGNLGDRRAVGPLLDELKPLRRAPAGAATLKAKGPAIYYYYVIRALGKLRDPRAIPLLEWVCRHERTPVLKGKSLSDVAATALVRIAERTAGETEI